ncbi:chitobiase/beta-hexosaminidase C-terminal domain-containing protein [Jiangella alba]|uniref:Ig-like domain (Group 3) n=1 Tax=Jiangella alba TaxID=561176 RepID=A0A1H5JPA2_9ACTN|nr:chitobiase/beta-hexosaminidase C-terminal domain-containing protein [Jiangella alba]SEE54306.1 Ig-like domain (group 3) [Jiangella alba]
MLQRLWADLTGRHPSTGRAGRRRVTPQGVVVAVLTMALMAVGLVPAAAALRGAPAPAPASSVSGNAETAAAQTLTWTADNSVTAYRSAPTSAVAGPTTIVFENSTATGNTSGMPHTLTFETGDPQYNQDVDVNLTANPFDPNGGRYEVEVNLTPGVYKFYCAFPGHGQMTGLLVVTGGGEDTTPPEVTATVTGDQNADGDYVGSATVTVNATDAGSGVDTIEYEIDDTGFKPYTGPVTVSEIGDHAVQYRATDNAGNTSPDGSVQFRVVEPEPEDTTPPDISAAVAGEQDDQGNYIGSATVTVTATDAESGVASVEYNLDNGGWQAYAAPVQVTAIGAHTLQYRATDNAGNVAPVESVPFTVVEPEPDDTTPPDISATVTGDQNADGDYVGSATVTVTATDAQSGVASVEYSLNGAAFAPYTAPVVVSSIGAHTVQYRATDNAGNVAPVEAVQFTVVEPEPDDTTPPEVAAAVTGEQNDQGDYVSSATVTITATDAESGVASIAYALDGGSFQPYTAPVVVSAVGDHTVQYRATDNAGNTSPVESVTFTVVEPEPDDTTPPQTSATVTGDQNADGDYVGSATVTITASDAQSGVASIEYNLDGAGFTAYTTPLVVSALGDHTVQYRATDNAGNVAPVQSVSFTVVEPEPDDTTPPDVSAAVAGDQNPDGEYVGSATVTITATDAESGVASIAYALDGGSFQPYTAPVVVSAVGDHVVQYRATDNAGNTSPVESVAFTVVEPEPDDTTPPQTSAAVTGSQNPDGDYIASATVTVTASDAQSGVASIEYDLDGAGFTAYTAPVVVSAVGDHTVRYRATDNAGNVAPVQSVTFTVVEPEPDDTTPPSVSGVVSGDQNPDGAYVDSATVTVTATDTQSGVASVVYSLDDGAFVPYTGPVVVSSVGEHTVQYRATDNAGNESETGSVTFTVVERDGDACPDSDTRPTVVIGSLDSLVANVDRGDGCTINDLIDDEGEWPNHGQFVRHVTEVANQLVTDGVITGRERGMLTRTAAASDVGRTPPPAEPVEAAKAPATAEPAEPSIEEALEHAGHH